MNASLGAHAAAGADVWADVVGQPAAVATLRAAVATPRAMTHAWLFTGPPGSGRSVAARAFAAALQCPASGCGHCAACRTVLAGTHADVEVIRPEGLSISVQEAREIVVRASRSPFSGRWLVMIIEDADRLTEQAEGALLKALEEPPARSVFLLCAPSVEDVLPTVRSRCRQVLLRLPAGSAVAEVLVRRDGVDPAMAAFAARAAQGHVGRARRLARDEEARRVRYDVLALPRLATSVAGAMAAAEDLVRAAADEAEQVSAPRDAAETAALREALGGSARAAPRGSAGALRELETRQKRRGTRSQRDALDRALVDLAAFYRDVLVAQLGAGVELVHADLAETTSAVARGSTPESTLRRLDAVMACREALEANVAPQLAVEAMALTLLAG